jgi:hypothetical protein
LYNLDPDRQLSVRRFYLLRESWSCKGRWPAIEQAPGYEPITDNLKEATLLGSFLSNNLTHHLYIFNHNP